MLISFNSENLGSVGQRAVKLPAVEPLGTDSKFLALKDLSPFKIVSKVQEANSILSVVCALSK